MRERSVKSKLIRHPPLCTGITLSFFESFAVKYFEQAQKDLHRAKRSLDEGDYPDSIFHSQQCAEKAVKAMIEAKRRYIRNHRPFRGTTFIDAFKDEWNDEFESILESLGWFTEFYTRSRYPFLLKGRVVSPDEFIDRNTAEEALRRAERALEVARKYLSDKGLL